MTTARRIGGRALFVLGIAACGGEAFDEGREASVIAELSSSARRARSEVIRDVAAQRGLTNGALLAGIADAETGMAHCWSEATWACQGPWSSSCNGPVIAGAGDGPCSIRQGGLGMFQFDGGNFEQTLARDGHGILTLEGNVDHAVDFVIAMVIRSAYTPNMNDAAEAIAWINDVPVRAGDARYEAWISTVTRYYNGCPPSGSCWASRRSRYSQLTTGVFREVGGDAFWEIAQPEPPPLVWEPTKPASRACGGLESHEHLLRGEAMKSCNELYTFVHQEDGNVVLYNTWSGAPVWATNTSGDTSVLAMQSDGNLVLYSGTGQAIWASGTFGAHGATLAVQDDGNVVIYAPDARARWATDTAGAGGTPPPPAPSCGALGSGTDLKAGESVASCSGRFVLIHQHDGNVVLYEAGGALWATGTDGKATSTFVMQNDGNLVLYADDGAPLWNSRTHGHDGAWLAVQDDGNVVVYAQDQRPLWATGTNR